MKDIKAFSSVSSVSEKLIRAVVRQCGGWDSFREMARDVSEHGAEAGFSGFILSAETGRFYATHRPAILAHARELAGVGVSLPALVKSFRCLPDSTEEEIGATLYGNRAAQDVCIANALAWFALEEVARAYVDALGA
jgi:hypothetical protein